MTNPLPPPHKSKRYTVENTAREICERLEIRDQVKFYIVYNLLERLEEHTTKSLMP